MREVRLKPVTSAVCQKRTSDSDQVTRIREGTGHREPRVSRKCSHVTEVAINLIVRVLSTCSKFSEGHEPISMDMALMAANGSSTSRRVCGLAALLILALLIDGAGSNSVWGGDTPPPEPGPLKSDVLCPELVSQANARTLPADFFVRLIWKESRFNPQAVSPKGAQGIAQFMPSTATERGLEDPFDPMTAIAESASYLADLVAEFGNVGLAAAAYNAGPERVRDWLAGRSTLPWETVDYVQFITGRPVEEWKGADTVLPKLLKDGQSLQEWCRALPMHALPIQKDIYEPPQQAPDRRRPWGVLLAEDFRSSVALAIFARLKKRYASVLPDQVPTVIRHRNPNFGRMVRYAVSVGSDSFAEAERLCDHVRARGGACLVVKN